MEINTKSQTTTTQHNSACVELFTIFLYSYLLVPTSNTLIKLIVFCLSHFTVNYFNLFVFTSLEQVLQFQHNFLPT